MKTSADFPAVEGEVIPLSAKKIFGLAALFLLLCPLCAAVDWCWWNDVTIPFINKQITWWGASLGLILLIIGVFGVPIMLWRLLVEKECLIIGKSCLQITSMKKGQQMVDIQVPYDEIEKVGIKTASETDFIGIRMIDIHADKFFHHNIASLEKITDPEAHHITIQNDYQLGLAEICLRIKKAMAAAP